MSVVIGNNKKVLEGFFTACDATAKTMGKEGRLALIEHGNGLGAPYYSKDGVTVCRQIYFPDEEREKNIGAFQAKSVAAKVLVESGDSTSCSLVLAKALIESKSKGLPFFKKYHFNSKVRDGVEEGFKEVVEQLKSLTQEASEEHLKNISTTSANNDKEIGQIVLDAYKAVGKDGIIDVIEGNSPCITSLNVTNGMKINKGVISPFLINNQEKALYEAEDALVIVYSGYEIHNNDIIKDFINNNRKKSIFIVAERLVSEDWNRALYKINVEGGYDISACECPYFDVKREAFLEDIALYCGGKVFTQGESTEVFPGKVKKVIADFNTVSFINEDEDDRVKNKVKELNLVLETATDKTFIRERIQALEGVSVSIVVGGSTDSDIREIKDRFDDSVAAIKSASIEGFIAGGGSTLVYISKRMNKTFENKDIQFGYNSIKKAIRQPFLQICENAKRNGNKYIKYAEKNYGVGFNVDTDKVSNLIDDSIVDSTKSIRTALEAAKSISQLLLSTEVIITN